MKTWAVLSLAVLIGWPMAAPAQTTHTLPLVRPADFSGQESLVRIVNRSATSGTVRITAIDDTGRRFGPVTLTLGARQALNITSGDLERGNAAKGLPVGVGNGSGSWRLELATALTIEPLAYIRTPDGFLTSMHDEAPVSEEGSHWVPFFNPGSNTSKVSHLRIINPGATAAAVTVTGRDDGGVAGSGSVRLTLAAGASRTLSAQDLERGGAGFSGRLGDGAGKWRLNVRSSGSIQVMSLLSTRTGHLANLSTAPSYAGDVEEPPPAQWGAIYTEFRPNSCEWRAGYALNYASRQEAEAEALANCNGVSFAGGCTRRVSFQQCGAVAYGERRAPEGTYCRLAGGHGGSRGAAEQNALSRCRVDGYTCNVAAGAVSGRRVSFCNTGYAASQAVSGEAGEVSSIESSSRDPQSRMVPRSHGSGRVTGEGER